VPQVVDAVAVHCPRGSTSPSIALAHVPFVPPVRADEQAWQAEVQAASQQRPSAQKPLAHCEAIVQAEPSGRPPPELVLVLELLLLLVLELLLLLVLELLLLVLELVLVLELLLAAEPPVPRATHIPATQIWPPLQSASA
jgi:hypothetical protein